MVAYLVNRYSTPVYPIKASIIIKENEENVGSKFLYDNELLNPYRNFFNELYIMRSYPLLQEVMESLNFQVSLHREGDIKTTEFYDPDFPIQFLIIPSTRMPYGRSMYFTVNDAKTFSLQYLEEHEKNRGKSFTNLTFNDTVAVNGYKFFVKKKDDIAEIKGKRFVVKFHNPFRLALQYSTKLAAAWAQAGGSVVNLEVKGEVPQKEIDFLNRFIERYQFYDVEKKNKVATMAMGFLDEQLLVIGDSLKMYEDQVENFKNRNIITNLGEETSRLYKKLQEYEDQKFQYRLTDNYYDYISELLKSDRYDGIFTPSSVGISDNIIAQLINQLIEHQTQVNLYKSYADQGVEKLKENPRLEEKLQRISYIKNDILKTIENSRKTEAINVRFINEQIKLVESELSKLPSTERELIGIKRNYSLKENLYVFLLQKRTEAGLSKASTTSDIMVVNPPLAGAAISPKAIQNFGIGAAAGIILPLLIFLLLEVLNDRIQSKQDIEQLTTVPIVSNVGHNLASDPLIVYRKPRSAMAEAFRALRSNLNYFTGNKDRQVFMITSSIPGEGKSFTTLNLATVFALAGKRTIIVGADLRKPKLFDDLNLHNTVGLSQYLSGLAKYEEIVQQCEIENLYLISGGPMPPNPSELLIRPEMNLLIERLRREFDCIIMDTPPLSFVTDAFVLSAYADHTLFVVRQDFTPKGVLTSLEENYSSGKLKSISILFNDLRKTGLGYGYGYGYNYGYGYGNGYGGYGKKSKSKHGAGYYTE